MRADLAGLPSPHPLATTLPALFQGQSFVERFCDALDEVAAPVMSTLDNLPAYFDVDTAPADFLPWLAYWLGTPFDPGQHPSAQRDVLRTAGSQQGWQGTARGLVLAVESVFNCRAVVEESGGADWSLDPTAALPGRPDASMVVRAFVAAGRSVDERRLDMVVRMLKPAHVVHRVEVRPEQVH